MSSLEGYRRKRDPSRTPEPFGGRTRAAKPLFVIQRHDARRLHYDLRLERHGALASWAVPKGLPFRAGERHLAVHVEDHPLDYGSFEGEIPKGEYGAGTVEIWDRGTYELLEEKRDGGLTFRLDGERARGVWTLVPAHLDGKEQNWLLLRKDAPQADGRAIRPQLASLTERLPEGPEWLFEPKWDGYRAIVTVDGGEARLTSRNGKDLTERFREVARNVTKAVRTPSAVLDGEVCALDEDGTRALRGAPARRRSARPDGVRPPRARWGAGRERPLRERRALLEELLDPAVRGVRLSPAFEDGDALLHAAAHRVSRASSPSGPTCRTERAGGRPSGASSSSGRRRTFRIAVHAGRGTPDEARRARPRTP